MDSEISEASSDLLRQMLTAAIVKICQELFNFKEFVHFNGQLSFHFDSKEKVDVDFSETSWIRPLGRRVEAAHGRTGSSERTRMLLGTKERRTTRLMSRSRGQQRVVFACSFCSKSFAMKAVLLLHERRYHSSEVFVYTCDVCLRSFETSKKLHAHRLMSHASTRGRFVSDRGFMHNERLERNNRALHCGTLPRDSKNRSEDDIRVSSTDRPAIESHATVNRPVNRHLSPDDLTANPPASSEHRNGEARSHDCAKCGKSFKTYAGLYSHGQVHLSACACVCAKCGKGFKTKRHLKAHERRHGVGERRFTCQVCGKAFLDRGTLTKHAKTVHAPSPRYACPACGKACNRLDNLRSHMRTHGDAGLLRLPPERLALPVPNHV